MNEEVDGKVVPIFVTWKVYEKLLQQFEALLQVVLNQQAQLDRIQKDLESQAK